MNFSDLDLGQKTLHGISEAGYTIPTPIQLQVIPAALQRKDLFGCAQTGTGKTASYTLPILEILERGRQRARLPRALVLTPTRELAYQVEQSFETYGKYHNFKRVALVGGESIYEQEKKLSRSTDVVIATPGRLLDIVERGKILPHAIEVLVIDEADRMLDMGFIPDVEKIISFLSKKCQILLFSATLSNEIKKIAHKFLKDPVEIFATSPSKTADTVEQCLVKTKKENKLETLKRILDQENPKNAIIFCNRKKEIASLCRFLNKNNYTASPIHGDLLQSERTKALEAFKANEINVLVASDVAARGIDVIELSCVINFDVPTNAEEYVHRIGRTGRAGKKGKAFTLMSESDSKLLKAVQKLIGNAIPILDLTKEEPQQHKKEEPKEFKKEESKQHKKEESKQHKKEEHQQKTYPMPSHQQELIKKDQRHHHHKSHSRPSSTVVGFGDNIPKFMMYDLNILERTTTKADL
jgi:superfamily II DNA/RNA helicase